MYLGKQKSSFSDSEFQNFIDDYTNAIGEHMELDHPVNNQCLKIDHDLIGA